MIEYPKEKLSERRAKDRKQMAKHVADLCQDFGIPNRIEEAYLGRSRCIVVHIRSHNGLCLSLDFDGESSQPDVFVLSWHTDRDTPKNLIIAPLFAQDRNEYHMCKATDVAHGWDNLMMVLKLRLARCKDKTDMIVKEETPEKND